MPSNWYLFITLGVLLKSKMKGWGQDFHFATLRLLKSLEYSKSVPCNEIFTCANPAILFLVLIRSLSVNAAWLQQSQKRPTTKSVICTLWIVHSVPVQLSRTTQPLPTCVVIAEAVTQPDFFQGSPVSAASHAGVGLQPANASDHPCNPDKHFLSSLPHFFTAFPPQLVQYNKSSVRINNEKYNPDCHLLRCAAKLQQGEN